MYLILNRDHFQKEEFNRLFKVLDARRVHKSGMKEIMIEERLNELIAKLAVYSIDLNWALYWVNEKQDSL